MGDARLTFGLRCGKPPAADGGSYTVKGTGLKTRHYNGHHSGGHDHG